MSFVMMNLRSLLAHASLALLLFTSTAAAQASVEVDETALPTQITGTVYDDKDASGRKDPGEPGIQGVSVVVTPVTAGAPTTVTTDSAGKWMVYIPNGKKASVDVDDTTLPSTSTGTWLQTAGSDPTVKKSPGSTSDGYCLMKTLIDCCAFSRKKVRIFKFFNGSTDPMIGLATIDLLWGTQPYSFPIGDRVRVAGISGSRWFRNKIAFPITIGFTGMKGTNLSYYTNTKPIEPKDWYLRKCGSYKVVIVLNLDTGETNTRLSGNCARGSLFGATSFLCWEMLVAT